MATGYSRGFSKISGDDIIATDFNNEFQALEDAFAITTGHNHDGTVAGGAFVPVLSDNDNYNAIELDTTNNEIDFAVEVALAKAIQMVLKDGSLIPQVDDDIDLGSVTNEFKNLYIDGTANIDSLVADTADINAGTFDGIVGGTTPAAGTFTTLVATTADINGGTFDGVVGGTTPAAGSFTTLTTTGVITPSGTFTGHLLPTTPNIYDLGSDALKWREAFLYGLTTFDGSAAAYSGFKFELDGSTKAYMQEFPGGGNPYLLLRQMTSGGGTPAATLTLVEDGDAILYGVGVATLAGGEDIVTATQGIELATVKGLWNGGTVAYMQMQTGSDTINKDSGQIGFYTYENGGSVGVRLLLNETGQAIFGTGSDALGAQSGAVTISTGDSGVTTPNADEDELIIEGSGDVGISILSPSLNSGAIVFGDPLNNDVGNITYQHTTDNMNFAAGAQQLFRLAGTTGNIVLGAIGSDVLGASVGSVTISTGDSGATSAATGGDDLIIEGSGSTTGLSVLGADANNMQIVLGGVTNNNRANMIFYGLNSTLSLRNMDTSGVIRLHQEILSNTFAMNATGQFILGDENADALGAEDGSVTISTGNSGSTTIAAAADDLIIEGSGSAGISVLTPATGVGSVRFGDPGGGSRGVLQYDHVTDAFQLYPNLTNGITIDSTGRLISGPPTADPVGAAAGSVLISTGDSGVTAPQGVSDELVIEHGAYNGGISILAPNTQASNIAFGDPQDSDVGKINYAHTTNSMNFTTNGAIGLTISSDGDLTSWGNVTVIGAGLSTEDARIAVGSGRSGNANSYLDLIGDTTYTSYGVRLIRNSTGANANTQLIHRGTGRLALTATDAGSVSIVTNNSTRLIVESDGTLNVSSVTNYENLVTADDDIPNKKYVDDQYSFLLVAEESAPLDTVGGTGSDGFQWSFGNGVGNAYGVAVPVACEITHLTLAEGTNTAITATVQVYKNNAAVTGATIALTAAASGTQVLATPVSLAAGDRVAFKTTAGTAQGSNGTVSALCRAT